MKKLLILLTMILFVTVAFSETSELKKIQRAIIEKGANWQAGENWVTRLSKEKQKKLCNYKRGPHLLQKGKIINLQTIEDLPSEFDWRNKNGVNWVTAVRDQGDAGSCWSFSTTDQLEAWWKIENSMPDSAIDLSEQFLISCNPNADANSGYNVGSTLDFIISQGGIAHEECFPYQEENDAPCSDCCSDWQTNAVTIPDWGYITSNIADVNNIKNAVYRHPVSASFTVYSDFLAYVNGVYEHVYGDEVGGHAVLITGWIDSLECWIVKNSWGTDWNSDADDSGYFKIKWGECDFGEYSEFVYNNKISEDAFTISKNVIDVSLALGDSTTKIVTYSNSNNSTELEYSSTIAYNSNLFYEITEKHFHADTYNSCNGKSWWCGDTSINGYDNHWLDYLETPIIDISNTSSPKLKFEGYWAVEGPAGAEEPYDGWDGCNVWISTDGGENFIVIDPTYPVYDCEHLWSFGHPGEGWNMGTDIAGWAGESGGWVDVEFDLFSYKLDSAVVIRFALASDLAYCVTDVDSLKGYFIDNIDISDETTTIFSDTCGDVTSMTTKGMDSKDHDWLTFTNGTGVISANSSEQVTLKINTKNMSIGNYVANIPIKTNDNKSLSIICNLEVTTDPSNNTDEEKIINNFQLKQNYPNPFNSVTSINYSINSSRSESVKLIIYDLLGKKIDVLVDKMQSSGNYEIIFNGNDYPSGIYFYKLLIGNSFSDTKKMVFLK
jgi:C1A family cysteine protease